jgi:hypothetical protein
VNFGSLHYFLELKTIENDLKSAAQCWAEIGPRLQHVAWRPTTRGQPEGWLGHGLAARSSRGGGSRVGRRGGALIDGPVTASRRQGLGLKHHGRAADASSKGSGGRAHRCGGTTAGQSSGSVRQRPHQREGRRCLWLAVGATGEDERGEGGSKSENGSGWVGLTVGVSYLIFMPKSSTHYMYDPGSIVSHIRPKVFTDIQMSRISIIIII